MPRLQADFDPEVVSALRRNFMTWVAIAERLDTTTRTLERWRQRTGFAEPTVQVNNDQLDNMVAQYTGGNPRRGERLTIGYVRSQNVSTTRSSIRQAVDRVDAEGKQHRKLKKIERRVYSVAGPMHLWHVDGHHKLIKYGIVTMACIDGYSRFIPYIRAVTNNRATTALSLFKQGTIEYGLPGRVRGDRGGENVLIAEYMIQHRGPDRGSYIAGPSRFNTRIERLWRDLQQNTIRFYKDLFMGLERMGLDTDDNVHMYCLQYMFLDCINESLQSFRHAWNLHPVRTERNKNPKELLENNLGLAPEPLYIEEDEYGIDGEENVEGSDDDDDDDDHPPAVHVNPVLCPLEENEVVELLQRCPPAHMVNDPQVLTNQYLEALEVVLEILQRE